MEALKEIGYIPQDISDQQRAQEIEKNLAQLQETLADLQNSIDTDSIDIQ